MQLFSPESSQFPPGSISDLPYLVRRFEIACHHNRRLSRLVVLNIIPLTGGGE
jgi:hypothetical protein